MLLFQMLLMIGIKLPLRNLSDCLEVWLFTFSPDAALNIDQIQYIYWMSQKKESILQLPGIDSTFPGLQGKANFEII